MTPLPKGLTRAQRVQWRRTVAAGYRPNVATIIVRRHEFIHPGAFKATLPFTLPATLA